MNKPIHSKNFDFDDKPGKFYMFSQKIQSLSSKAEISLKTAFENTSKPLLLFTIKDRPLYSTRTVHVFGDYNAIPPEPLFYIINDLCYALYAYVARGKPDNMYIAIMHNGKLKEITAEEYGSQDFDFSAENSDKPVK